MKHTQRPSAAFATAAAHHQAGRAEQAERGYRQVLAVAPRHAECRYRLGVLALQTGRPALAVAELRAAIALAPQAADYYANLGVALQQTGRPVEAEATLRAALRLRPGFAQAEQNRGGALMAQGEPQAAEACFRRALAAFPQSAGAHNNLGLALAAQGQMTAASACFRRAAELDPSNPDFHNNLAATLLDLGQSEAAVACCRAALRHRPDHAEAHNNLGTSLRELRRTTEAIASFRRAIALRPDYADAHTNLGAALAEDGRPEEALASCQRSLALRPDFPHALNNLATVLRDLGRLEEAVRCYRRAVALRPDFADAQTNLGMALLAGGDMAAGWPAMEWRWRTPGLRRQARNFTQPQWRGEAVAGASLLIHHEQGFGDTLQFCRYAPLAAALGLRVVLVVPPPLVRLMHSLRGVDAVLAAGAALPETDFHCPTMSLPLALGTTLATVPAEVPYLHADADQVAAWRTRLAAMPPGLRAGLVWAGNPSAEVAGLAALDRRRSLPPAHLAPLLDVPGVQFFSLQKDGPRPPADWKLHDFMTEMQDFADTAALVATLDLVISVDTAVAHLAGALGRPVWLLDRFGPCWRWLVGRRDTPWYPDMRIYRQPAPGAWDAVVAAVAADLRSSADRHSARDPCRTQEAALP